MTAGKLDVFQHPTDDDGLAIGNAIHVHLDGFFQKLVH